MNRNAQLPFHEPGLAMGSEKRPALLDCELVNSAYAD
jgi:hypothetical protein